MSASPAILLDVAGPPESGETAPLTLIRNASQTRSDRPELETWRGPVFRARLNPRPIAPTRRRRRLRREVRLAGSALLICTPLAWAILTLGQPGATAGDAGASRVSLEREAAKSTDLPIRVGIAFSPEPGVETSVPQPLDVPVVQVAGYLLPAEDVEESDHARP